MSFKIKLDGHVAETKREKKYEKKTLDIFSKITGTINPKCVPIERR